MQLRATFGDALLQAHLALIKDLQALHAAARATPAPRPADLASQLDATRSHIAWHFAFEEENGYMSSVIQAQPHLARIAESLAHEHQDLLASLDEVRDETRTVQAVSDRLRKKIQTWVRNVRLHERRENALVQDAFNVDLTAED